MKSVAKGGLNDWVKYKSKSQGLYYYRSESRKQSLWINPANLPAGWVLVRDQTQKSSYYNIFTDQRAAAPDKIPWATDGSSSARPAPIRQPSNSAVGNDSSSAVAAMRPAPPQGAASAASASVRPNLKRQRETSSSGDSSDDSDQEDAEADQRKAAAHYNRLKRSRVDRGKGSQA